MKYTFNQKEEEEEEAEQKKKQIYISTEGQTELRERTSVALSQR